LLNLRGEITLFFTGEHACVDGGHVCMEGVMSSLP